MNECMANPFVNEFSKENRMRVNGEYISGIKYIFQLNWQRPPYLQRLLVIGTETRLNTSAFYLLENN